MREDERGFGELPNRVQCEDRKSIENTLIYSFDLLSRVLLKIPFICQFFALASTIIQNNRATHLRNLARGLDGVGVAVLSDALLALFCDCYCALSSRLTLHPRGTSEQLCPSVFCFSFTKFLKTTFPDDGDNLFGQVQLVPNGLTFHYCYARSHFRPSVCFANHLLSLSVNLSLEKKLFLFHQKCDESLQLKSLKVPLSRAFQFVCESPTKFESSLEFWQHICPLLPHLLKCNQSACYAFNFQLQNKQMGGMKMGGEEKKK